MLVFYTVCYTAVFLIVHAGYLHLSSISNHLRPQNRPRLDPLGASFKLVAYGCKEHCLLTAKAVVVEKELLASKHSVQG